MYTQLHRSEDKYYGELEAARLDGEEIGEARGVTIGKLAVAQNLLKTNMPLETIATMTNLPLDELKKLMAK